MLQFRKESNKISKTKGEKTLHHPITIPKPYLHMYD